jgi:hypothetical protein
MAIKKILCWSIGTAMLIYAARFLLDEALMLAGLGLGFLLMASAPLLLPLALGAILGAGWGLGALILRRRWAAIIGLALGIITGLGAPLLTREEIHFRRHRASYEMQIEAAPTATFRPGRYYRPLVYVADPAAIEQVPWCGFDGAIVRRLDTHWFICQEDFN